MKKHGKYTVSALGAALLLSVAFGTSAEAKGTDAGVAALMGEYLSVQADIYNNNEGMAVKAANPQESICGYYNLGIADVEGHLNVREGAGEDYELVGKLPANAGCEILSVEGDWSVIQSGKVTGYVKNEFLLTGEAAVARAQEIKMTVATINDMTVYLRTEPNTDCTIWTAMPEGEELTVIEDMGEWVKVDLDGDECYVYGEYVDLSEELTKAMTMTEVKYGQGVSDVRVDIVNYACQFVGNPYVWGGTSLTNGADCSGFTMQVYAKYGIYLPHHSGSQPAYGRIIDASEAKPGDLFFYSSGRSIDHVAMYIGNGQVVHASDPRSGIKISNAYYRTPTCVASYLD